MVRTVRGLVDDEVKELGGGLGTVSLTRRETNNGREDPDRREETGKLTSSRTKPRWSLPF